MADSGVQTATGDGEWLFPTAHTVYSLAFWIDTDTVEVDYLSTFPPRRVMHAGWIGVSSGLTGEAGDTLSFADLQIVNWFYLEHEANMKVIANGFQYYDRVTFHIPTGVVVKFTVFYDPFP